MSININSCIDEAASSGETAVAVLTEPASLPTSRAGIGLVELYGREGTPNSPAAIRSNPPPAPTRTPTPMVSAEEPKPGPGNGMTVQGAISEQKVYMATSIAPYSQQGEASVIDSLASQNRFFREIKEFRKNLAEADRDRQIHAAQSQLSLFSPRPLPINQKPGFELDLGLFPSDLVNAASALSRRVGIPVAQAVLMLLQATNIALRGCYVASSDDWDEAVTTNTLLVIGSGAMKTECIKLIKEPFEVFINDMQKDFPDHQRTQRAHCKLQRIVGGYAKQDFREQLKQVRITDVEAIRALVEKNLPNFKEIDALASNSIRALPRIFVDKVTPTSLAISLSEQGECMACMDTEGAFITDYLNKKDGDIPLFLKANNYEPYSYESKNVGPISLKAPAIQMLVYTQPVVLEKLLKNKNFVSKGGLARILPIMGQKRPALANDGFDAASWDVYLKKIRAMLSRNFTQETPRSIHKIIVSEQAGKHLLDFAAEVSLAIESNESPYLEAFLSKLAGTAMRLAANLHSWTHLEPEKVEICGSDMHAGIALAKLFWEHAEFLYKPKEEDALEIAIRIIGWVQRWSDRYSRGYFTNGECLKGIHLKEAQIEPALDLLARSRYVVRIVSPYKSTVNVFHPIMFTMPLPQRSS